VKTEDYSERRLEVGGWQVNLASWRLGGVWHCRADNVSPGATLARMEGDSKEDVERRALEKARELLARTRRQGA
jgi:hypothetical protein